MRTLRRAILALSSLAVLSGVGGAAPAAATTPAVVSSTPSGWVVARRPTVASYTPAARDRGNSAGGSVTVTRLDVGQYTVYWDGLQAAGTGNLQVSALGSKMRHCIAFEWQANADNAQASIYCYQRSSSAADDYAGPVDSAFVAVLIGSNGKVTGLPGRMGFAFMDLATFGGTPDTNFNKASSGGLLTSTKLGTGSYLMTVPGMGKADGDVVVTEYEGGRGRCQVRGWKLAGADLKATVDCVDLRGTLSDEDFDFLYLRHLGLEGFGTGRVAASLWANQPTAAQYHPAAARSWSTSGDPATIRRTSKGVYAVTLPGMPAGGAAIVTAYGPSSTPRNCQVGAIRGKAHPQIVTVRCFYLRRRSRRQPLHAGVRTDATPTTKPNGKGAPGAYHSAAKPRSVRQSRRSS
ncbi:MAG: hypothetical protein U0869_02335 [Chloroflexota bacterium]